MKNVENHIKVVELFAGVGGFRLGLERSSLAFETIWANQWEPEKKAQHAYDCYVKHFGKSVNHINEDIALVKDSVPVHDLLVGGFPCQDYSVARSGAKGIEGKKGVLWWQIRDILEAKLPSLVLLENVDRLIRSPAKQRGRDFAIILRCLADLGYAAEWRVINAADYGFAQKRRRLFIFAFKKNSNFYNTMAANFRLIEAMDNRRQSFFEEGFFTKSFPIERTSQSWKEDYFDLGEKEFDSLQDVSNAFAKSFYNSGIMIDGLVYSVNVLPKSIKAVTLREIRQNSLVDEKYFLNGSLEKWQYLKGSKKIERIKPNGEPYFFSEGAMNFPDDLDKPGRTMLTSESSVNRSSHVIEDAKTGKLRLLTPIECERLNGFDDNWTETGMPEKFRYFVMGNALVVPVITKIGQRILEII